MKITVRNIDDKRTVIRLGKAFKPKSETTLEVSEAEYRALKAVRRLEVRAVAEVAPAKTGKALRASAKMQGTGREPATGAKGKSAGDAGAEKDAGKDDGKKAAGQPSDSQNAGSTGDKE
jgi:hypothetical protein